MPQQFEKEEIEKKQADHCKKHGQYWLGSQYLIDQERKDFFLTSVGSSYEEGQKYFRDKAVRYFEERALECNRIQQYKLSDNYTNAAELLKYMSIDKR